MLEKKFEGNDDYKKNKRYRLKSQFESFSHVSGENLSQQVNRFKYIVNELRSIGYTLDTGDVNEKL